LFEVTGKIQFFFSSILNSNAKPKTRKDIVKNLLEGVS